MRSDRQFCPNMNHGKANPPVTFCPSCGEKFVARGTGTGRCADEKHAARRKDRSLFCCDCGKDLNK